MTNPMLSEVAQYITPTGRWCRWVPKPSGQSRGGAELFLYNLADGRAAPRMPNSSGFYLMEENLGILRRVG